MSVTIKACKKQRSLSGEYQKFLTFFNSNQGKEFHGIFSSVNVILWYNLYQGLIDIIGSSIDLMTVQ